MTAGGAVWEPSGPCEKSPGNEGSHQHGRSRNDSGAGPHAQIRLFGAQLAQRASQPSGTPNGGYRAWHAGRATTLREQPGASIPV